MIQIVTVNWLISVVNLKNLLIEEIEDLYDKIKFIANTQNLLEK
ncbi:hypothetical protein SMU103_02431 [Streptococcus mutans SA38]|nr:hypothetical protein SMU103_02431 [Streptococcus mutans SA38]